MSEDKMLDLDQLAKLACLDISAEEREFLAKDMEAIVAFASRLPEVDELLFDKKEAKDVKQLREDLCGGCLSREELLASAHTKREGYITVPRVWKEES